jgi:hypothetical protein
MCPDSLAEHLCARTPAIDIIVVLNNRWCVVNDSFQWILAARRGRPSAKASRWRGEHFCRQRTSPKRRIREHCGDVDPSALSIIEALPEWHFELGDK